MVKQEISDRLEAPTENQLKEFQRQVDEGLISRQTLQRFLIGLNPVPRLIVEVDCSLTGEELVKSDRIEFASDFLTHENLPSPGSRDGQLEVFFLDFVRFYPDLYDTEGVINRMDELGLRPATLVDLMAVAALSNVVKDKYIQAGPTLALGSSWTGPVKGYKGLVTYVPRLKKQGHFRSLSEEIVYGDWKSYWRFAAVHK